MISEKWQLILTVTEGADLRRKRIGEGLILKKICDRVWTGSVQYQKFFENNKGEQMRGRRITKRIVSCILAATMVISTGVSVGSFTTQASEAHGAESSINEAMKLWYTTPANINTAETNGGEWMQQSLPLGNGNLGNLIFGGVSKERIHFNEKTLWTGGPSDSRPNYQFGNKSTAYTAEEIEAYRQILDDKSKRVFNDSMSGYGYVAIRFPGENNLYKGSYQDFGDIWLDYSKMGMTEANVTDYRRELDLQTGIASTVFTYDGVEYQREHFVSSPDQVMVTRVSASEAGKLNVTVKMELNNGNLNGTTTLNTADNSCTIAGKVTDNGLKFRTTMKIIPEGGTVTANTIEKTYTVKDADSFLIIMAAETDYKNDYPTYRDTEKDLEEVADGRVEEAAERTFEELKERHLADHQELFDRVSLDLGEIETEVPTDQLVEQYRNGEYSHYLEVLSFQFGRYLTIAGSRGTLPSNLVGLWTVGDSAWTGDYHFNVNVQMNYWPVYVTNLAECGTTMVEYMENLREPGRLTAERVHGIEGAVEEHTGFVVHTENNPFGMTAPSNYQEYGWNPTGAAWAIQNLWAHYEFTQDETYLEETIYPIMKEAALFWDQYLWTSNYQVINDENSPYDGQNRLVVAPSFSEEQGPTAVGTTYDQSLVWELYNECIKAGEIIGEDPELLDQWQENMDRLDPIEINETNGIKEWYEETRVGTESGHHQSYAQAGNLAEIAVPNSGWNIGHPGEQRHASHLVGLYPGTLINKENEEYMSAAIQSLTERGEYSTGWSKANKINLWARTGNGEKAYTLLNHLIGGRSSGLQYNLFDSHGSGGGETMENGTPVWQIDGNYGLTSGVAEMLLQSQLGYVQFLPAIPEAWSEGEVQGLKARGNFTIGEKWSDGIAEQFTVCYEGDEKYAKFECEYPEILQAEVYQNGKKVKVTKDEENGRISFTVIKGKTYVIEMPKEEKESSVTRIAGTGRYETAYLAADFYKEILGTDRFDAVVVATGKNFADALSGSYLAAVKNAPILLTNGKTENVEQLHAYIKENVKKGGTIYLLGGSGAVPESVQQIEGYQVKRLEGTNRYETNLEILKEAGITGDELIVATGKNFADSLSASAVKTPILLVKPGDEMTAGQKAVLEKVSGGTIYIIGGEGAVSGEIERELKNYATVQRISGGSRYETSAAVAETFFGKVDTVLIASGKNFPDGLCGGPLAAALGAPLILTTDGKTEKAAAYVKENDIVTGYVLGGEGAVKDSTAVEVFSLKSADEIVKK